MKIFRILALSGATVAAMYGYHGNSAPVYAASVKPGSPDVQTASAAPRAAHPNDAGAQVYQANCAVCHGEKMEGIAPSFPSLIGKGKGLGPQQLMELIHQGRGRMPAFTQLRSQDMTALVHYIAIQRTSMGMSNSDANQAHAAVFDSGASIFQQNCGFCHGKDAGGGESGPDLTRSKLVAADVKGDKISLVIKNGRPENKMPRFNFSDAELTDVVRFIHSQATLAASNPGHRKGVDVADLQTGNVAAGKAYFQGTGNCASCHSPTGDLAGVATRYQGLELEERMLYPGSGSDTVTVTLPSGQTLTGKLAYQDEFTIGLRDATGTYRSWPVGTVKYTVDSPVMAHVELFPKYTDADIHNLMAYIQTLR